MRVALLLFRVMPGRFVLAVIVGIVSGLAGAGLIRAVKLAIGTTESWVVTMFIVLAVARLVAGTTSNIALHVLSNRTLVNLRLRLAESILTTPFAKLEAIGAPRLRAALTDDIELVGQAATALVTLTMSAATLLGGAFYLAWLSVPMFVGVLLLIGLGVLGFLVPHKRGLRMMIKLAREKRPQMYRALTSVTKGTKELKQSTPRRVAFFRDGLTPSVYALHRSLFDIVRLWEWSRCVELFMLFVVLGCMMFVLPRVLTIPDPTIAAYVLTLVYLIAPLDSLLYSIPAVSHADVILESFDALEVSLSDSPRPTPRDVKRSSDHGVSIALEGIVYSYKAVGERPFTIGPIDLALNPGEIVFLTGGNGSGKSTLGKILVGLYAPAEGVIRVEGEALAPEQLSSYRDLFSVIFPDFFLFDRFYGIPKERHAKANEYLKKLALSHKVKVDDARFSTRALSQGQRKRLSLIVSYLEDKPACVFDEWAADQDPAFKRVFYTQLLPELKALGKTVVVISHDDEYFHLADRRIHMEDGKTT